MKQLVNTITAVFSIEAALPARMQLLIIAKNEA